MENNDVDEEDFYKYLACEHEDEDCAISMSARNYPTHATRVTFDDDDNIIEFANYLTEVEFSDSDALATRVRFLLTIVGNLPPQERGRSCPCVLSERDLSIKPVVVVESVLTRRKAKASPVLCMCACVYLVVSLSLSFISQAFISTFPTQVKLLLTSRVHLPDRTLEREQLSYIWYRNPEKFFLFLLDSLISNWFLILENFLQELQYLFPGSETFIFWIRSYFHLSEKDILDILPMADQARPQSQPAAAPAPVVPEASLDPGGARQFLYQQLNALGPFTGDKVKAGMNEREREFSQIIENFTDEQKLNVFRVMVRRSL